MPAVTTLVLIDRAKATADSRDNFVTPTQWMYWCNQERQSLDLFIARSGWTQNVTVATIDLTAGSATTGLYPLVTVATPSLAIMALVGIWEKDSSGHVRALKQLDAVSFMRQAPGATLSQNHARYYTLTWSVDKLIAQFYPAIGTGESYIMAYIPAAATMTLSDSVSYPMGWEERIVLGMARRALMKEESETRAVDEEIRLWEGRIEEACWSRVLAESPTVRNMDASQYGWGTKVIFPSPTMWWWS